MFGPPKYIRVQKSLRHLGALKGPHAHRYAGINHLSNDLFSENCHCYHLKFPARAGCALALDSEFHAARCLVVLLRGCSFYLVLAPIFEGVLCIVSQPHAHTGRKLFGGLAGWLEPCSTSPIQCVAKTVPHSGAFASRFSKACQRLQLPTGFSSLC